LYSSDTHKGAFFFKAVVLQSEYHKPRRNGEPYPAEQYEGNLFLKNGYAIIVQHVRGRGDSGGSGVSYNLTETITSLSHICPKDVPGESCTVDILTPPIGARIKRGNRIRVDISSHSDLYVPHANVRGNWATVEMCKIAENTVIFDEEGCIALPLR